MNTGRGLHRKIENDVLEKCKMEDSKWKALRGRSVLLEWRMVRRIKKYPSRKWSEDCWAGNFSVVQRIYLAAKARHAQQQRMKVEKDMTRKIKAKGRMDTNNSWCVSELLAAAYEKAWLHAGSGDIMQKWYDWLPEMKKKSNDKKCWWKCKTFA